MKDDILNYIEILLEDSDITISEKVIDAIFEQVENVTEHIDLAGGEIMLALDMFEYFCNKLIESNWTPQTLLLVTNVLKY